MRLPGSGPTSLRPPDKQETKGAKARKPSKAERRRAAAAGRGSVIRVAERLGLDRSAVYRLMKSYGIKK